MKINEITARKLSYVILGKVNPKQPNVFGVKFSFGEIEKTKTKNPLKCAILSFGKCLNK